jgi:hypothetical protein
MGSTAHESVVLDAKYNLKMGLGSRPWDGNSTLPVLECVVAASEFGYEPMK